MRALKTFGKLRKVEKIIVLASEESDEKLITLAGEKFLTFITLLLKKVARALRHLVFLKCLQLDPSVFIEVLKSRKLTKIQLTIYYFITLDLVAV